MFGYSYDVTSLPGVEVGQSYSSDQTFVHKALHCCPSVSVVCVCVINASIFPSRHQLLSPPGKTHTHTNAASADFKQYIIRIFTLTATEWDYCLCSCSLKCHWPVHEVQVQVGETKMGQAGSAGFFDILWVMFGVPQFGCYEHLLTRQHLGEIRANRAEMHKWLVSKPCCS